MSEISKKEDESITTVELQLGVANGGVPSDLYSQIPCTIGYSYIRFEVNGNILPCCIAKHPIGATQKNDWRDVWHSGALQAFRRKLSHIHLERFHLTDSEWIFCQQCSHVGINEKNAELLKK